MHVAEGVGPAWQVAVYRTRLTPVSEGGSSGEERVSAAEVIAALSRATDLSLGSTSSAGLRSTLVAVRLAGRLEVDRETAAQSYYACLLATGRLHRTST